MVDKLIKIPGLIVFCLITQTVSAQALRPVESKPLVFGLTEKIQSEQLAETRTINIYLPEDFNPNDTISYPVIYIPDGGAEEDFFHLAGIVRYNTQPWIARFPKSIVVGIENTNRKRDFSFAVANLDFVEKEGFKKTQFPAYGGSAKYIAFIEKELQPYIRSRYKGSAHTTIIGESMAGLLATEILLRHRHLFDDYIIVTPSLWWGDRSLLKQAPDLLKKPKQNARVYIAACNKDEDSGMYEVAVALKSILENDSAHTEVYYDYLPDEIHATALHQAVYNAFRAFYPKTVNSK